MNPLVSKITFVPKAQALKEQRKKFPELTKALPFNPYPDAYRIQPKKADYLDDIRGAAAADCHRASTTSRTAATPRNACSRSAGSSRSCSSSA